MRRLASSVANTERGMRCYGYYYALASERVYPVYDGSGHSRSIVVIMRGAESLTTCRGANGFSNICRILRNTVSPVLKVKPSSVGLGRLVRHLTGSRMGRIVVTAGSDLRKRAATVCVDGLVGPAKVGIDEVTDKIPMKKSLRCVSRIALLHTLRKHIRLWNCYSSGESSRGRTSLYLGEGRLLLA